MRIGSFFFFILKDWSFKVFIENVFVFAAFLFPHFTISTSYFRIEIHTNDRLILKNNVASIMRCIELEMLPFFQKTTRDYDDCELYNIHYSY